MIATSRRRVDIENCLAALAEVFGSQRDLVEVITLVLLEDKAITWQEREEILQAISASTKDEQTHKIDIGMCDGEELEE